MFKKTDLIYFTDRNSKYLLEIQNLLVVNYIKQIHYSFRLYDIN